ncbi:MAG: hypothetical protein ACYTJ0_01135 [Planctomycetota bacterium]|jgi:hypothetical protein
MKAWMLVVLWLAVAGVLALAVAPLLGPGRALLVPLGWCAGGLVGGIGGAIFTIDTQRREARLKRTLSAAIGAAMTAVFLGAASDADLAAAAGAIWKAGLAMAAVVVVAPVIVLLSFWVNDVIK